MDNYSVLCSIQTPEHVVILFTSTRSTPGEHQTHPIVNRGPRKSRNSFREHPLCPYFVLMKTFKFLTRFVHQKPKLKIYLIPLKERKRVPCTFFDFWTNRTKNVVTLQGLLKKLLKEGINLNI